MGGCRGAGAGSGGDCLPRLFRRHSAGPDICRKKWLRSPPQSRADRARLGQHPRRPVAGLSGVRQPVTNLDRRFGGRQVTGGATGAGRRPAALPVLPDRPDRPVAESGAGRDPHRYRHRHARSGFTDGLVQDRSGRVRHWHGRHRGDSDCRGRPRDHSRPAAVVDLGTGGNLASGRRRASPAQERRQVSRLPHGGRGGMRARPACLPALRTAYLRQCAACHDPHPATGSRGRPARQVAGD